MIIDETKRLIIREIKKEEACAASEYFKNVMGNKEFSKEMTYAYIDTAYGFYGYGYWGLFEKENGDFVGLAGFREGSVPLEIGYYIAPEYRMMGYASEAVKSLLEFAEEDFLWVLSEKPAGVRVTANMLMTYLYNGKVLVYAKTERKNSASVAVLRKNGFVECEEFFR